MIKTKAGTNGKQVKINQDCGFIEQKLPFGLKCYFVCDGHGLNGHIVSAYIKTHMISKWLIIKREPDIIFKKASITTWFWQDAVNNLQCVFKNKPVIIIKLD